MAILAKARQIVTQMVSNIFKDQRKQHLEELLRRADEWKPNPSGDYSFRKEMENRVAYYYLAMQDDMEDEFKKHFPQRQGQGVCERRRDIPTQQEHKRAH
jgi:hypothetical protein